jgi:hypothetical protein
MQKAIEHGADSGNVAEQFAITCCFLSSLKTLLTLMQGNSRVRINVLDQLFRWRFSR